MAGCESSPMYLYILTSLLQHRVVFNQSEARQTISTYTHTHTHTHHHSLFFVSLPVSLPLLPSLPPTVSLVCFHQCDCPNVSLTFSHLQCSHTHTRTHSHTHTHTHTQTFLWMITSDFRAHIFFPSLILSLLLWQHAANSNAVDVFSKLITLTHLTFSWNKGPNYTLTPFFSYF